MGLSFDKKRSYDPERGGVSFPASYNGKTVDCFITAEALAEAFDAGGDQASQLAAFDENVGFVIAKATTKFEKSGNDPGRGILLKEVDFQRPH